MQQAIPCAHHGPLCFWYRNLVRRHEDFSHLRHPVWLILKRSKSAHTHLCALSPAPRASLTSPSAITSRVRVGAGIPSGRGPVSSGVSETHIVFVMSSCALSYELMRRHRRGSNPRLLDQVIICIQEVQTKNRTPNNVRGRTFSRQKNCIVGLISAVSPSRLRWRIRGLPESNRLVPCPHDAAQHSKCGMSAAHRAEKEPSWKGRRSLPFT